MEIYSEWHRYKLDLIWFFSPIFNLFDSLYNRAMFLALKKNSAMVCIFLVWFLQKTNCYSFSVLHKLIWSWMAFFHWFNMLIIQVICTTLFTFLYLILIINSLLHNLCLEMCWLTVALFLLPPYIFDFAPVLLNKWGPNLESLFRLLESSVGNKERILFTKLY